MCERRVYIELKQNTKKEAIQKTSRMKIFRTTDLEGVLYNKIVYLQSALVNLLFINMLKILKAFKIRFIGNTSVYSK